MTQEKDVVLSRKAGETDRPLQLATERSRGAFKRFDEFRGTAAGQRPREGTERRPGTVIDRYPFRLTPRIMNLTDNS
jgi:hypothetical protein